MIGTPFHERYCETAMRGCRHMLAETVKAARGLASEANMAIGLMNRREGQGVYLKLVVRERDTTPEVHWFRLNKNVVTLDNGRKIRTKTYLKGLRRHTYDRRTFNFVPVAYRPIILGFEDRAAVIRRNIASLADLQRAIEAVAQAEPFIDASASVPGAGGDTLNLPALAELME